MYPRGLSDTPAPVYVLGDLIIDEYIECTTHGLCDAVAAPILKYNNKVNTYAGGAGLVAAQLRQFDVHTSFVTRLDGMHYTNAVVEWLASIGVNVLSSPGVTAYIQTVKQRFIATDLEPQRVVQRIDRDTPTSAYATYGEQLRMLRLLVEEIPADAVLVLADYGKGCLHGPWYEVLMDCFKEAGKPLPRIVANMHRSRCWGSHYVVTANVKETVAQYRTVNPDGETDVCAMAEFIRQYCGITYYVLTRGAAGLTVLYDGGRTTIDGAGLPVLDSTGAGDVVTAVMAYAVASGYDVSDAAQLAHELAEISTHYLGTSVVAWDEVVDTHWFRCQPASTRVYSEDELPALAKWRETLGSTYEIGFTNGCFDLLHAGHTQFLLRANRSCGVLIVGVNTDETVRKLKGNDRPIQSCADRCLGVATIADIVIPFSGDTPHELIAALRPDVLYKGHGYDTVESAVGHELVTAYGGEVRLIPGDLKMCATSNTIAAVRTSSCQ